MAFETIIVEIEDHIALIKLNRPDALNALNAALLTELSQALMDASNNKKVRCIVITGSEKAFAAGADITEMADKSFVDTFGNDLFSEFPNIFPAYAKADNRSCLRIRPRRRMRTGHDVRLHHRIRYGQVWPTRNQPGRHGRTWRLATPDPLRWQVQVYGHEPNGSLYGCRRS